MTADLTVLVVGDPGESAERTRRALDAQTELVSKVAACRWDTLSDAAREVSTEFMAMLPAGVEPGPLWCAVAMTHMGDSRIACMGGRTLLLDGPATLSPWFDIPVKLASMSPTGRLKDRFTAIPFDHLVQDVLFLRLDTMVARSDVVQRRLNAGVPYTGDRRDLPTCLLAARLGYRVVYDSAMIAVSDVSEEAPESMRPAACTESGRADTLTLRWHPRQVSRLGLVALAILVGTRQSPGLLVGPLYATRAERRSRWLACVTGKLQGLRVSLR